jgi:hypothetical protein
MPTHRPRTPGSPTAQAPHEPKLPTPLQYPAIKKLSRCPAPKGLCQRQRSAALLGTQIRPGRPVRRGAAVETACPAGLAPRSSRQSRPSSRADIALLLRPGQPKHLQRFPLLLLPPLVLLRRRSARERGETRQQIPSVPIPACSPDMPCPVNQLSPHVPLPSKCGRTHSK